MSPLPKIASHRPVSSGELSGGSPDCAFAEAICKHCSAKTKIRKTIGLSRVIDNVLAMTHLLESL